MQKREVGGLSSPNFRRVCARIAAAGMLLGLALWPAPGAAQSAGGTAGQPQAAPQPEIASVALPIARMNSDILGFRSARFGDSEAAVRAAMAKDLKVKPGGIVAVESSTEKTQALVTRASNVIPVQGSGTAEASYVLGRQTRQLIQVSLAWSRETDPKLTDDQLLANAALLNEYFRSRSSSAVNERGLVPLVDGRFLLFRGEDSQKHTVMLIARGPLRTNADGSRSVVIQALWLYYVANLDAPDAFRLPEGSF